MVHDHEPDGNPADAAGGEVLFKWETLKEVGPHVLNFRPLVSGKTCEVELVGGRVIQAWRADDGRSYFCHGLTFGGKAAPGGPVSPFTGPPVETILVEHYRVVDPESQALPGDIIVWKAPGSPASTPHSAIITNAVIAWGKGYLDYRTELLTKNGMAPEAAMSLGDLVSLYGETYNVYRRK